MSSSFYRKSEPQVRPTTRQFDVGEPDYPPTMDTASFKIPETMQQAPGQELTPAEREKFLRERKEALSNQSKIGDYAKKRLELLADIGRLTADVVVEGITFSLRTLKAKEARDATMSIFNCSNDADAAYEIRRQTLARAVHQIDGLSVEEILGTTDFEAKLELIDDMEDTIIIKLYNEFNALRNEVQVKYGVQTAQEVKEVVNDLKK